ncbi:MAG TPA: response regulator [Opitutaceae bacterium]|jgi:hypothetical protein|nr:response regulator [Opitutaceae bacterium]
MTLSIGNKIGAGFAVALAALVAVGVSTSRNLRELDEDSFWVRHTIEVKSHVTAFIASLLRAESYGRGYELAPDPETKVQFTRSAAQAEEEIRTLRSLTQDNPAEVDNLARLSPLLDSRLAVLRQMIQLRDEQRGLSFLGGGRVTALVQRGREEMTQIDRLTAAMNAEEDRLLAQRQERAASMRTLTSNVTVFGTLGAFGLVLLAGYLVTRSIVQPLRVLGQGANRIGGGEYGHRVQVRARDETGRLAELFNRMAGQVQQRQETLAQQDWLKGALARFSAIFQGQRDLRRLCEEVLAELAGLLDARQSAIYVARETEGGASLRLMAAYASENLPEWVRPGEGLIGQALADGRRVVLTDVPADYLRIRSALGERAPAAVAVLPARFEDRVKAVVELAAWKPFTAVQLDMLEQFSASLGIVLNTIEGTLRTEELLRQSQQLAESLRTSELELQEQQEELKQTNEELEQTNEEMQQTNEEMEEKVHLLAEQKKELERANEEIGRAREKLEEQARQVNQASKYKSDFLASMSHELRTPLNSMLILSRMLADNGDGALSPKQVQYAETIYSSGNDLLELINEILDLSKIESGNVEVETQAVPLPALRRFLLDGFQPVADAKRLEFRIDLDPGLPEAIRTDERRIQQILKNLLSNAFKFTDHGSVVLTVAPVSAGWDRSVASLNAASAVIAFTVKDSGIGIAPEKQQLIFEAFQQADAGTARRYGGTGLGLSISRELAWLLGGAIALTSEPGLGSAFTLYLPSAPPAGGAERGRHQPSAEVPAAARGEAAPLEPDPEGIPDDRGSLAPGDLVLLIIEDDPQFARILADFAREKRFKVLAARTASRGLALARQLRPSAITLDLKLPDSEGWVVLDRLKHDPATRQIPVHLISADPGGEPHGLARGAVSYVRKPVTRESLDAAFSQTIEFLHRPIKRLLIVEDDAVQRQALAELVGGADVQITAVSSGAEALAALGGERCDCVVLDLGLPDLPGLDLIREIQRRLAPHPPPVIVYTGKELSREEETQLRLVSDSIVVKSARSPERLLDETALFLHRVQSKLPESGRRMIEQSQRNDSILAGRKVLVVDDDVRNIFAITSALEASHMDVRYAESGQAGIDLLTNEPGIEAVLMDVMMPEMDGFEAIRRIRRIDRFKKLPIISVTAKAMKGDREKCLEAGASDYITKPVEMDQLRSLLRVWLYR